MATKDISDIQVIESYMKYRSLGDRKKDDRLMFALDFLIESTGQPAKVCHNAMERAYNRGYIECGVSLRSGWVTAKGNEYYNSNKK